MPVKDVAHMFFWQFYHVVFLFHFLIFIIFLKSIYYVKKIIM